MKRNHCIDAEFDVSEGFFAGLHAVNKVTVNASSSLVARSRLGVAFDAVAVDLDLASINLWALRLELIGAAVVNLKTIGIGQCYIRPELAISLMKYGCSGLQFTDVAGKCSTPEEVSAPISETASRVIDIRPPTVAASAKITIAAA